MGVTASTRRERIRHDDGTYTDLPGGEPATGLSAISLCATDSDSLTGAARAAVYDAVKTPHAEATIVFESSTRTGLGWVADVEGIAAPEDPEPYVFLSNPTASTIGGNIDPNVGNLYWPSPTLGRSPSPSWSLAVADVALADDPSSQVGPVIGAAAELGVPWVLRPVTPLVRLLHNAEAAPAGEAWGKSGGGTATYSRPSDGTAPALGLAGTNVHRLTGTLAAGTRLSSPWGRCRYMILNGVPRVFTVAAWARSDGIGSWADAPVVRWVFQVRNEFGVVIGTGSSDPFTLPVGEWRRVARPVVVTPTNFEAYEARVYLEVVSPGTTSGATTVSIRAPHAYAGPDRGDTEGLRAVPIQEELRITASVNSTTPDEPGGGPPIVVNRIDVHGVDRLAPITSASAELLVYGPSAEVRGWSAGVGRLTIRTANRTRVADTVQVLVEEVGSGPGGDIGIQLVDVGFEVDVSDAITSLEIDRALDADPSSSSVPIGNYAATTLNATLDDADGDLELFARTYIQTGHRVDTATGVVYTNRHDDPQGVDTHRSGAPSAAWPVTDVAAIGSDSLVPVTDDAYGQRPPAAYCGATPSWAVYESQYWTTAPAVEGQTFRVSVWVRWLGGAVQPAVRIAGAVQTRTPDGWAVGVVAPIAVPVGYLERDRWYLIDCGEITLTGAVNTVVAYLTTGGWPGDDGVYQLAAPKFERVVAGEVVEVVETAPAGVFYSTTFGGGTGGTDVQLAAVDVLAARGGDSPDQGIVTGTTVQDQVRGLARQYLDLGDDQVVTAGTTSLPVLIPTDTVASQLADLAKAAALTAYTDGLGRLVAVQRITVASEVAAEYLDDRNLIEASAAVTPEQIRNDVRVTVHPTSVAAAPVVVGTVGRPDPVPTPTFTWEGLDDADIEVAGGTPYPAAAGRVELWIEHGPALDVALSSVQVVNTEWLGDKLMPGEVATVETTSPFGDWYITVETFATSSKVTFLSGWSTPTVKYALVHAELTGRPVTVQDQTTRYTRDASITAYGRSTADVDVRLAQASPLAAAIGADVLDNWSLIDETGERWLPDLEATVLGDPWRELGDRVVVQDRASGLAGEYRVLSHRYTYGLGADSALYLRRVREGYVYLVLDVDRADDGKVASY